MLQADAAGRAYDRLMAREEIITSAQFTVTMAPQPALLPSTGRFDMSKEWTGAIRGTSTGVMLSAGDPSQDSAGYVALETVTGSLDGRAGTFALAQFGTMADGAMALRYEIVPGSGTVDLIGLQGSIDILSSEGVHEVVVRYSLP